MHSTGVYKAAIIQYLRRHADKLHPISVWNPCVFVLVCVRVLRCFIWFSAQSYPIITVCAQPMNTLPLALLIQMYVRQSGCLWRTEGGALTKQQALRQKMWANLPCWHGRIHFNHKCPPPLCKNETQQPSTKWSVGKEGGCSTLSEQDTKTATCCFDFLVVVLMLRWHYFLHDRGFSDSSFTEHDAMKIQPLFLQDTLLLLFVFIIILRDAWLGKNTLD